MIMENYRPYTAQFYVYARNEKEVQELTKAINDFVRERYHSGTLVRADSLMKALETFRNNLKETTSRINLYKSFN